MYFSSLIFVFRFLPVFFIIYYLAPEKLKNLVILLGSMFFYAYGEPRFVPYIIVMILLNYFGAFIMRMERRDPTRKRIFILLVFLDLAGLFYFKYFNFVVGDVMGYDVSFLNIVLPLGISFYTFQLITYVTDVYRGKYKPELNPVNFGAYISMFPQLIAGPIVKFDEVGRAMRRHRITMDRVEDGLVLFSLGLGLKVIMANNLYTLWNTAGTIGYESLSTPYAWLCALGLSFYIFFDFWGYSLMAVGLGQMMGFRIPRNFNCPYISTSFTEFWRRWHMTLGRFFKEYVYIPLGGNKVGALRNIFNTFVIWFLTGIWHGADYNFVIWGLFLFVMMVFEKYVLKNFTKKYKVIGHIYMLLLIPVSWLVFSISDLNDLRNYLMIMAGVHNYPALTDMGIFLNALKDYWFLLLAGILLSTRLPFIVYGRLKEKKSILLPLAAFVIFGVSTYFMIQGLDNPFLYFRF